jgi:hypothetical protein
MSLVAEGKVLCPRVIGGPSNTAQTFFFPLFDMWLVALKAIAFIVPVVVIGVVAFQLTHQSHQYHSDQHQHHQKKEDQQRKEQKLLEEEQHQQEQQRKEQEEQKRQEQEEEQRKEQELLEETSENIETENISEKGKSTAFESVSSLRRRRPHEDAESTVPNDTVVQEKMNALPPTNAVPLVVADTFDVSMQPLTAIEQTIGNDDSDNQSGVSATKIDCNIDMVEIGTQEDGAVDSLAEVMSQDGGAVDSLVEIVSPEDCTVDSIAEVMSQNDGAADSRTEIVSQEDCTVDSLAEVMSQNDGAMDSRTEIVSKEDNSRSDTNSPSSTATSFDVISESDYRDFQL